MLNYTVTEGTAGQPNEKGVFEKLLKRPVIHILIITLVGLAAYSNTFNVPFQWDDLDNIRDNHTLKNLDYFTDLSKARADGLDFYRTLVRRYVGYLSFALNYRLHGLDVRGYHAVNIAIHLINALLLYLLVALSFRTPALSGSALGEHSGKVALFSALLFVAHPVQTEAVTYIFQRLASLTTLFYLLSLTAYIRSRLSATARGNYGFYAISFLSAVLAMKTKENAFTLPVAITLYEFLFMKGPVMRRLLRLAPLILTMAIIPASFEGFDRSAAEMAGSLTSLPRGFPMISREDYFFTQLRVLVTYLRLLVLPVNQNLVYDYPLFTTLFNPQVLLSLALHIALFGAGAYFIYGGTKGDRALYLPAFGVFWFYLTISVESSIVPIPRVIDEYRIYLPSAGLFAGAATGGFMLYGRTKKDVTKKTILSAFCVAVVVLSAATYARNSVWKSRVSLWEDVTRKSPYKSAVHTNLGRAYGDAGMTDKAIGEYIEAIRLSPYDELAHNNLGNAYYRAGLTGQAMKEYETVLEINPASAAAHINLCKAYKDSQMLESALMHCRRAVSISPNNAGAHYNLAVAFGLKGTVDAEIAEYQTVIRLKPEFAEAHTNLGAAYAAKGLHDKAVESYMRALSLNPKDAFTENNLAIAHYQKGSLDKAVDHYLRAIKLRPSYSVAHNNIAVAYEDKGLPEKAKEHYITALASNPGFAEARIGLAKIYIKEGSLDMALAELSLALKYSPGNAEAKKLFDEINQQGAY